MGNAKALIELMPRAFDAQAAGELRATVQFAISTPMYAEVANGACTVHAGQASNPDVTVKMKDHDLVDLFTGKLNGMAAFVTGKLKVDGNIALAQKLPRIFDLGRVA